MNNEYPMLDDFPETVTALRNFLVTAVEVGETWTDDHLLCFNVSLTLSDGSTHRVSLWWVAPEIIAAARYFNDSPSARNDFITHLKLNHLDRPGEILGLPVEPLPGIADLLVDEDDD